MKAFFALALFLFSCASAFAQYPKARLVYKLSQYKDIVQFKSNSSPVFIHTDNSTELKFGRFEKDKNPQKRDPWNVVDVLYEDVPSSYEVALSLLANNQFEEAKEMFLKSASDDTQVSKRKFSTTKIGKNYLDEKLLMCSLGLNEKEESKEYFKKIIKNKECHSYFATMIKYIPFLVQEGDGSQAEKIIKEVVKLPLSKRKLFQIGLQRCLAISLQKKYSQAKSELKKLVREYRNDIKNIQQYARETEATILVYHEKNYRAGIKFFNRILEEDRTQAKSDTFMALAECHFNEKQWEKARWNYIQAFLVEYDPQQKEKLIKISDRIVEINTHLNDKKGQMAINSFFEKLKTTL